MTPAWFLPVLVLAQSKPLPLSLQLATPATARVEMARIDAPFPMPRRRMSIGRDYYLTPIEFRAQQAKYRNASPPPVCNGNVCALPVLAQLADNPRAP